MYSYGQLHELRVMSMQISRSKRSKLSSQQMIAFLKLHGGPHTVSTIIIFGIGLIIFNFFIDNDMLKYQLVKEYDYHDNSCNVLITIQIFYRFIVAGTRKTGLTCHNSYSTCENQTRRAMQRCTDSITIMLSYYSIRT